MHPELPELPELPRFQLAVGHRYGPGGYDLRNHDGRGSLQDSRAISMWQATFRQRITRLDLDSGVFDAQTQQAALHVQRLAGLPATGVIDEDTWRAVWTVEKPKLEPPAPKPAPRPVTKAQVKGQKAKVKDYWRRVSNRVEFVSDGSQPPWWPGRPFGPGEHGWHVSMLQRLLQARETGRFTQELGRRVRAARRLHGLPVSDVVSLDLAVALDPGPWG